jgi:hypothetical protein
MRSSSHFWCQGLHIFVEIEGKYERRKGKTTRNNLFPKLTKLAEHLLHGWHRGELQLVVRIHGLLRDENVARD